MRTAFHATVLLLSLSTSAAVAAPYPASKTITGIDWETSTYSYAGVGGDIWPITWHGDGTLRGAYGDGQIGCSTKVSYGTVAIGSMAPSASMQSSGCGPSGTGKGKIMALGAAGSVQFASMGQQAGSGSPIARSTDGGRNWVKGWTPAWQVVNFVNFGPGNSGAPDGYVYALDHSSTSVKLTRFPPDKWNVSSAYQYFSGTATAPAWSTSKGASKSIFTDPAGVRQPTIQYVPGLRRYLLAVAHTGPGKVGVFEAPAPWGPWSTVYYGENWLGLGNNGKYYSIYFPLKWQSADGRTLWATFSCHNEQSSGACGPYHDRLNMMRVTLRQ